MVEITLMEEKVTRYGVKKITLEARAGGVPVVVITSKDGGRDRAGALCEALKKMREKFHKNVNNISSREEAVCMWSIADLFCTISDNYKSNRLEYYADIMRRDGNRCTVENVTYKEHFNGLKVLVIDFDWHNGV